MTGAEAVFDAFGSIATSRIGRLGSVLLPPVTFVHVAEFAVPAPRPRPTWTLPSFVPTIARLDVAGEYASWLMYERFPSDAFVRFAGLLTYQLVRPPVSALTFSQTRTVPAIM